MVQYSSRASWSFRDRLSLRLHFSLSRSTLTATHRHTATPPHRHHKHKQIPATHQYTSSHIRTHQYRATTPAILAEEASGFSVAFFMAAVALSRPGSRQLVTVLLCCGDDDGSKKRSNSTAPKFVCLLCSIFFKSGLIRLHLSSSMHRYPIPATQDLCKLPIFTRI